MNKYWFQYFYLFLILMMKILNGEKIIRSDLNSHSDLNGQHQLAAKLKASLNVKHLAYLFN